jgi:hypothetical protein
LPTYRSSRPQNREASGSGPATDPALVSILSKLIENQERAERHRQQDRQETTAAFAQVQARQDEFQRQVLELQRQQQQSQQQYLGLITQLVQAIGIQLP